MSGRIHPRSSSAAALEDGNETPKSEQTLLVPENHHHHQESSPPSMYNQKHLPPPGTYVIQIPKDQIYRLPPPENAHRFKNYTTKSKPQRPCCRCFCWTLGLITLLIILAGISTGIFYLVIRPQALIFSVDKLSIKNFNLNSSEPQISPEFDLVLRAENPNKKISFFYKKISSVAISHSNIKLSTGTLPEFYQPPRNVTVFKTALTGKGLRLTEEARGTLMEEAKRKEIPLEVDLEVPVRVRVGSVKTWTIRVRVHCDVSVDRLMVNAKIVEKKCGVAVKLL